MSESLLHLRGVTRLYEKEGAPVRALDAVDLDVDTGEYAALLGPSGSGKSTLLHVLGCLDAPSAGSYRLAGVEVLGCSATELALQRRRIGFVFQAFHLLAAATALENVALPLRYAGVPPAERSRRATEVLTQVGLADRLGHRPTELSGGQQQRVAIARALVADPLLLRADEPTGNLDSKAGAEIIELLERLWRAGRTLIVVTHDPTVAARAPRAIRMLDGRIVADERQSTSLSPIV